MREKERDGDRFRQGVSERKSKSERQRYRTYLQGVPVLPELLTFNSLGYLTNFCEIIVMLIY